MRKIFAFLLVLLFASQARAIMLPILGSLRSGNVCTEESCSGDCLFSSNWEGSDNVNTSGTSQFNSVTGTVTWQTSNWDTSCPGHSVAMVADGDYLTSNNGSNWNFGKVYIRLAFQVVSTDSWVNGDYNYLVADSAFRIQLRVMQEAGALNVQYWVYHDASVQKIGTSHGISTGTWYSAEIYYDDTTANGLESAGWKLFDDTGTLIHPAAGFDELTNLDLIADGSLDTIYVGPSKGSDSMSVEIDKFKLSSTAIGAPTR